MENRKLLLCFIGLVTIFTCTFSQTIAAEQRTNCINRQALNYSPHSKFRERLHALRNEMRIRASVQTSEVDGYIITTYDEHQNEDVAASDKRLEYLSGFTGSFAYAAITLNAAAIWTDIRYIYQADIELDCDWVIFELDQGPSVSDWLSLNLNRDSRVGADPKLIPHFLWSTWEIDLANKYIRLVKINRNIVDIIWGTHRPPPPQTKIKVQRVEYTGQDWFDKIQMVRQNLVNTQCDAMVISSLTEIAYILNLRGHDLPYIPVFKAYFIITLNEILLYTDMSRIEQSARNQLSTESCFHEKCVKLRNYDDVWTALRTYNQIWKRIFLAARCVYDLGVSEAIYSSIPKIKIHEQISPVVFMKAEKSTVERAGMTHAAIRDGVAMCDFLSYFEEKYGQGESWTEQSTALEVDRSRRSQDLNQGISFKTIVASGSNAALPHYIINNITNANITDLSTVIIESGGQYLDGTTIVTRTVHLGKPTDEQKIAYTAVISGVIRTSMLIFPDNLFPDNFDANTRESVWKHHNDYPHGTGHGVGSYLAVHESPINIAYSKQQKFLFKDGYFFSSSPGFYKRGSFGIRLGNVLEVNDTLKRHPSGMKFLSFKDSTYVPFEPKLIDPTRLSAEEKKWLNEYNAKIRILVGEELKKQMKMTAFYWMMNKTMHVKEYLPKADYEKNNSNRFQVNLKTFLLLLLLLIYKLNL